jgi:hypothetical protein
MFGWDMTLLLTAAVNMVILPEAIVYHFANFR